MISRKDVHKQIGSCQETYVEAIEVTQLSALFAIGKRLSPLRIPANISDEVVEPSHCSSSTPKLINCFESSFPHLTVSSEIASSGIAALSFVGNCTYDCAKRVENADMVTRPTDLPH